MVLLTSYISGITAMLKNISD